VDHDSSVHAVVITGAHPTRFISHADVRWLQEGGAATPSVGQRGASAIVRAAEIADSARVLDPVVARTPLQGAVQLDRLHATFLRMKGSGVIVMAAGDSFIGHPEVLLGINPGGGGTQRLTRLIGTHRSMVAILEGKPFTPA